MSGNSLYKRSIKPNLESALVGLYKNQNKYIDPSIQEDIQEMKMIFSDDNSILKEIRIIVKYDDSSLREREVGIFDQMDLMIPFDISDIKKYFNFDNNSNNRIKIKFGQPRPYDKNGDNRLYINNRCIGLYIYDSSKNDSFENSDNIIVNNIDFELPDTFGNSIYSPYGDRKQYIEEYKYITLTKISIQEGIIFKNCTFKNSNLSNHNSIEVGIGHQKMVNLLNKYKNNSYRFSIDALNYLELDKNDHLVLNNDNIHITLKNLFNIIDNQNCIENPGNLKSSIRVVIGMSKPIYQLFLDSWSHRDIVDGKIIPDLYKYIFNKSFIDINNENNKNIFPDISYIVPKDQMFCTFSATYRYFGYFGYIGTGIEKELNNPNKGKIKINLHNIKSIR